MQEKLAFLQCRRCGRVLLCFVFCFIHSKVHILYDYSMGKENKLNTAGQLITSWLRMTSFQALAPFCIDMILIFINTHLFLAEPTAYKSSWTRDPTHAIAVNSWSICKIIFFLNISISLKKQMGPYCTAQGTMPNLLGENLMGDNILKNK